MAQAVGKYAANKFLKKHMKGYANKKVDSGDDPYFAMVENPRKPGKFKKVKKQIPTYIPEHDAMVLASVRKSAYRLDMSLFNFMGIRFGWEAVIGIVPGFGDVAGVALALLVYRKACTVDGGLASSIRMRMILNIILDFVVGLVPFVGDLADAAFKANTRNLRLLEVCLDKKYKPRSDADERHLAGVDKRQRQQNRKSGIYHLHDPPPATVFEDFSDEEEQRQQFVHDSAPDPAHTAPTALPEIREDRRGGGRSGGGGGGWFSGRAKSGRRDRDHDIEMTAGQETGRVRP